jgi:uncharacterized Zn-binding protein involved in type VI secretion
MLGATRLRDWVKKICSNKESGPFFTGSSTTFINNRPQVRVLDKGIPGVALTGSKSSFVDNRPAVRQKDKVSCGRIMTSSTDTFIGD